MNTAPIDLKLEVVVIPVADVDRSKRFYEGLGWRLKGRRSPDLPRYGPSLGPRSG